MIQHKFRGTGTALVTPFRRGKVDYEALEKIIEHNLEGGVDFLVSLGTTGEAVTLTTRECKEVLRFTLKINNGRVPVVAGLFGDNDTTRVTSRLADYDLEGFAAVMSSSPSYTKPSQEGIFQHYMKIAKASPLPVIIYNVPGRTASNVAADTTLRLANASEKFMAVKEASCDLNQITKIIKYRPEGFLVLSGDDPQTLAIIASGGDGVISVIANALPAEFSGMTRAALAGDFETARRLNLQLSDIHPWLYVDGNPAGIKTMLEIMGFCKNDMRLPLVPVRESTQQNLRKELEKAGVLTGTELSSEKK
ncbi:MAG: 4-hydroxy-tetrahydrodipicolinate synthase [Bacteroidota bacterium]